MIFLGSDSMRLHSVKLKDRAHELIPKRLVAVDLILRKMREGWGTGRVVAI